MNNRNNPLFWSFGAGTWAGVHLRISWLMPVLLGALLYHFGLEMGGTFFGIIFGSVLLHEIGHILAARATEGSGDEILMWPFGGLAFVETTSTRSQIITAAAGPFVNLVLCVIVLGLNPHIDVQLLNPLVVPITPEQFAANVASSVQALTFWVNWAGLLLNLIPAYPLDGGQIFRSILMSRMGAGMGTEVAVKVAMGVAIVMGVAGALFFTHVVLVCISFLIILLAVLEHLQLQATESYDDSFMGYDFSQGYTSLERSDQQTKPERRAGLVQRWLARRRAEKLRRQDEQEQLSAQQLDAILAKVHAQGIDSLTQSEKRLLKRASNRYRSRGDSQ